MHIHTYGEKKNKVNEAMLTISGSGSKYKVLHGIFATFCKFEIILK